MYVALHISVRLFPTTAQYSVIDIHHILHFYLPSNRDPSVISSISCYCVTDHPKIFWLETRAGYCFSWACGLAVWLYWDALGLLPYLWPSVDQLGVRWSRRTLARQLSSPLFFLVIFLSHFLWCGQEHHGRAATPIGVPLLFFILKGVYLKVHLKFNVFCRF